MGIYDKAEALLLKAYDEMKPGEGELSASTHKLLTDTGARIVALYDESGAKAKADDWRKRLAEAAEPTEPKP